MNVTTRRHSMKRLLLAAAGVAAVVGAAAAADEMHTAQRLDAVKWAPSPRLPKGALVAVLHGNPGKAGHYIILAKFPDGFAIPAHWHTNVENVTVISGTFHVGMGDRLDKSSGEALGPGGFFSSGSSMHHYAWTTGETLIQVTGMGPFDVTYVNHADDPSSAAQNFERTP
jgi:ChrR-like protein with cupin domain